MTQPPSKVFGWPRLAYTLSLIGLILSGMMHLGTYIGALSISSDKPIWLYINGLTLVVGTVIYYPAYWSYIKAIYAFNEEEWKYPESSMNTREKRRLWRIQREVWKSNPTYAQIGMPHAPRWMRAVAFPFLSLSLLYLSAALLLGAIINPALDISNWYVLHSMTLVNMAIFFTNLSLYHSKLGRKHSDQSQ